MKLHKLSTTELTEIVEFNLDTATCYEGAMDDYDVILRWLEKGAGKELINLRDRTKSLAETRMCRKAAAARRDACMAKAHEASAEILNRTED